MPVTITDMEKQFSSVCIVVCDCRTFSLWHDKDIVGEPKPKRSLPTNRSDVGFVILFLVGFFSSSDSTGGSVDAVDEDVPWDETDPMFYEMHADAMDF